MNAIELAYGRGSLKFDYDERRFSVLTGNTARAAPLTDLEVGAAFDSPIASPSLDEVIGSDDSVLIVVSDATRATGSAQVVNLLARRLIQTGVSPARMAVVFATGIHRRVSEAEKVELLTPFIVQRLRILDHDAYAPHELISLGPAENGVTVEVNRALREFTRVIVIGGVTFHYFAGFTGGRKSICPGLASARTIEATHMLALDLAAGGRRAGVRPGQLEGNPVHEACERVAAMLPPAFGVNTVVDEQKRVVRVFCGDWRLAHRAACDYYLGQHSMSLGAKRDLVITSCGGFPHDINLIQAHKALDMASLACKDGGTIVLVAECSEGLGRPDFLKWFEANDARALAARLVDGYEVNGQTAWALLAKAESFRVFLVSKLPDDDVKRMRMSPARNIGEALEQATGENGFILPRGAAMLPRIENTV